MLRSAAHAETAYEAEMRMQRTRKGQRLIGFGVVLLIGSIIFAVLTSAISLTGVIGAVVLISNGVSFTKHGRGVQPLLR